MSQMVKCPDCGGHGSKQLLSANVRCPTCCGTGEIDEEFSKKFVRIKGIPYSDGPGIYKGDGSSVMNIPPKPRSTSD